MGLKGTALKEPFVALGDWSVTLFPTPSSGVKGGRDGPAGGRADAESVSPRLS